ncbi:hypothetical protein E5288_WYG020282 [Bos mutus]|uniref:Uncharacterized protein n=1 Tax=Bos mutus TaxID=72004 RepID=A0A6B0S3F7_9CETA|nr:hypothetical protein [Bos mutus]
MPTEAISKADTQRGRNQRADTDSDQSLWLEKGLWEVLCWEYSPGPEVKDLGRKSPRSLPNLTCTSFIGRITWAMHNWMRLSAGPAGKRWLLFPPRPSCFSARCLGYSPPPPPHGLRPMRAFRSYRHCLIRLPVPIVTYSCFCYGHLRPRVRRTSGERLEKCGCNLPLIREPKAS